MGEEEIDVFDEVVQVLVGVEEAEEFGGCEIQVHEEEYDYCVDFVGDLDEF